MSLNPSKWNPLAPAPRPEKVLERYYPQLREWADILTRGDRARSEDIVHDLYLYIALAKPDFARIQNLDNYLYQCLRNMYLSTLARASREALESFAVEDFDSLPIALWMKPNRDNLQQQNDLRRICCYAVWRKPQVRAASYFVLRFFHGYRMHEIAEIACVPLEAIQRRLSEARAEVRSHLAERPRTEHSSTTPPEPVQHWNPVSSQALIQELRTSILTSRTGDCLSEAELHAQYRALVPKPVSTSRLSHIVSCEDCLARIDKIGRRPTLKDREPLDGTDGAALDGEGEPGAASGHHAMLRKARKHRDDVYDHRPQSIAIAVDGKIMALHEIQAQRNMQSARIERPGETTFVEVFSEQGLRLAMLSLDQLPPNGPHVQVQRIPLSDRRWIDLKLSMDGQGLYAEVVYFDPALPAVHLRARSEDEDQRSPIRLKLVSPVQGEAESKFQPRLTTLWSRLFAIPVAMNPLLASAAILGLSSLICVLLWTRSGPRISPTTLLARADQSDASAANTGRPEVIYQKVRIAVSSHTMERAIYRDPQRKRRLKPQRLNTNEQWLKDQLTAAGVNWDEPLSAADYQQWHDHLSVKQDAVTRTGKNLLTLTTAAGSDGPVFKESLTVRESDFHPVGRTIELRDQGKVEIAELNYDIMPWGAVNQDWFEPLAGEAVSDVPVIHAVIHLPHALSELELDQAELTARITLNQLHADSGEPIELKRGPRGIDIQGVVDTNVRQHQLVSHLSQLPHVHVSIQSVEEMGTLAPSAVTTDQPVQVHSFEAEPSPLEQYLREKKLPADQRASISHNLLASGLRISQAEIHFSELQPRFQGANQFPIGLQNQLAALSHTYLDTINAGLDANQSTLLSLGFNSATQIPEQHSSDEDIAEQIRHYRQLCLELIVNRTEQSRSAAAIAEELINTGERIRLHIAEISQTIPTRSN